MRENQKVETDERGGNPLHDLVMFSFQREAHH
jgi:hypothetical protein